MNSGVYALGSVTVGDNEFTSDLLKLNEGLQPIAEVDDYPLGTVASWATAEFRECLEPPDDLFRPLFAAHPELEEALAAYDQAIHLDPSYAVAYYSKGNLLMLLERLKGAQQAYEEARHLGYKGNLPLMLRVRSYLHRK